MSSQPNRLKPNTTAFTMLRRGWTLITPDGQYKIIPRENNSNIFVYDSIGNFISSYPLTADGFEAMMNEVVNPPF